jgi:hypothetical protein
MKFFERIKAIILTPAKEWGVIARERGGAMAVTADYLVYLAAVPAIADLIGMSLIGFKLPNGARARVDVMSAIMAMVFDYVLAFVVVAVVAAIINAAAPFFGAGRNMAEAFRLSAYSYTPMLLSGIFLLVPGLHFLVILGLYGLFVLFKGMPVMIRTPAQTAFLFAAVITACATVIVLIVGVVRARIFSLPGIF